EWAVIAHEGGDVQYIYINYVILLAAIPAAALLVGLIIIGDPLIGRPGITWSFAAALAQYVNFLLTPIVGAVVIQQLAPKFRSHGDTLDALKLVAYSTTPVWLAGAINIVPLLGFLILVGAVYALYLFYVGLPVMMKTPPDQVVPFMVVSAIVVLVVSIVLSVVVRIAGVPV